MGETKIGSLIKFGLIGTTFGGLGELGESIYYPNTVDNTEFIADTAEMTGLALLLPLSVYLNTHILKNTSGVGLFFGTLTLPAVLAESGDYLSSDFFNLDYGSDLFSELNSKSEEYVVDIAKNFALGIGIMAASALTEKRNS